jgi:hypothetical protein
MTPGAGCSITSTATVSTTGVTGRFTFRATFFAGMRLGLALATVRFAALRALPLLGEFRFGSFPRFCAFDCFLRLAITVPLFWLVLHQLIVSDQKTTGLSPRQSILRVINRAIFESD